MNAWVRLSYTIGVWVKSTALTALWDRTSVDSSFSISLGSAAGPSYRSGRLLKLFSCSEENKVTSQSSHCSCRILIALVIGLNINFQTNLS